MVNFQDRRVRADFGIKINFEKDSVNPSRVFKSISDLIESFHSLDKTLIASIDASIEPILLLEDIQQGSIIVFLKNFLQGLDDDALKEISLKKMIGSYLVKAKYAVIDFINQRAEITDSSEVLELQAELLDLAEETRVSELAVYNPVNPRDLLMNINSLQDGLSNLNSGDEVFYLTPDSQLPINLSFRIAPESIDELLTKETIENEITMILKVKKPDYLGESKWDFRHTDRTISAKMNDLDWLKSFQSGNIDVRPGDSIKAEVVIVEKYDYNNEVISTQYFVSRVISILRSPLYEQSILPLDVEIEPKRNEDQ